MSDFNLTKWYRDFYLAEAKDKDALTKLRKAIRGLVQEEMEDFELEDRKTRYDINPEADEIDLEDLEAAADYYDNLEEDENITESEENEEESEEETEEDIDVEVDEDEDEEAALGTIAADMEGSEGEIMDHLMSALRLAKQMGNDKLNTQIGNTLKFFVSEYIAGGE